MMGKVLQQECEMAGYIAFIIRKQGVTELLFSLLSAFSLLGSQHMEW